MNSTIETLNDLGARFLDFAWPMLWQSSLLIAVVLALDLVLACKIRAAVRHALWLVVLLKLLLPPTLALPTGAAWWLCHAPPAAKAVVTPRNLVVTYDEAAPLPEYIPSSAPLAPPLAPSLERVGWMVLAVGGVGVGLLFWLLLRWAQVIALARRAAEAPEFSGLLEDVRRLAGLRTPLRLRLVNQSLSPAVCGLFRPVILLPRLLAEKLSPAQLRAVLLHEASHLRRRDIWVNCAQAVLQLLYWWHPLVWLANARLRRVREDAVDDAVMLALAGEADVYAPTLLEVAKLAFRRPVMSLGLVGILESRSALRQRIERLMDFRAPRRAGLTLASLCGILAFSAVALPMGEGPAPVESESATPTVAAAPSQSVPASPAPLAQVLIEAQLYEMPTGMFNGLVSGLPFNPGDVNRAPWWSASPKEISQLTSALEKSGLEPLSRPQIQCNSGQQAQISEADDQQGITLEVVPTVDREQVGLALIGMMVNKKLDGAVTNQYVTYATMANHGGLVARMQYPGGVNTSNVLVVLSVKMLANASTARFQQRLIPLTKPRSAGDSVSTNAAATPGIISNPNFANVLDALRQQTGVEKLAEPERTVVTGRSENLGEPEITVLSGRTTRLRSENVVVNVVASVVASVQAPNIPARTTSEPFVVMRTFRLNYPKPEAEVSLLLLAAGVKMPPTIFGYTDNGIFMLRGTTEQLVLANRMVEQLNGYPTNDATDAQFILTVQQSSPVDSSTNASELFIRTFKIDPLVLASTFKLDTADGNSIAAGNRTNTPSAAVRNFLHDWGVNWESPAGKTVFLKPRLGIVFVKATRSDLDIIERAFQMLNQPAGVQAPAFETNQLSRISDIPVTPSPSDSLSHAADLAQAGKQLYEMGRLDESELKFQSMLAMDPENATAEYYLAQIQDLEVKSDRQQIVAKLDQIRIPSVQFEKLSLKEVLRQLTDIARQYDPDKIGVPISTTNVGGDIDSIAINIPPLSDVRLVDVLDAIVLVSDQPIRYSVHATGVIFLAKNNTNENLLVRTFQVDSGVFSSLKLNMALRETTNHTSPPAIVAQSFFRTLGINWEAPRGKSVSYNAEQGVLFVKATESDLDLIERALQIIATPPPQLHLKARFIEVPKGTFAGFNNSVIASGPASSSFAGILTRQNAGLVLQAMQSEKGADILGEPEVTLSSGRHVQMRATQIQSIVTNLVFQNILITNQDGAVSTNGTQCTLQTNSMEFGPILDAVPYVLADGDTINLTATASLNSFLGYNQMLTNSSGQKYEYPHIMPTAQVTAQSAAVNLYDGQTLVLLLDPAAAEPVHFPGADPQHDEATAKHIRAANQHRKTEVLAFITATIVNTAGAPVHAGNEMPFRQHAIPSQH